MNFDKILASNWAGAFALLSTALGLVFGIYFLFQHHTDDSVRLPVLAIGGVIALLVVIALVAGAYTLFNLANPAEALGLPEGSVRAIIALSLIVLFVILTIYLYSDVSNPKVYMLAGLSEIQLEKFLASAHGSKVLTTINTAASGSPPLFNVYYQNVSAAGGDFAKQLLVMIGTLMTSVTSFYFASKPASVTTTASADTSTPAPEPTRVSPSEGVRGSTLSLVVSGNHLRDVTSVKLVLDKEELVGTGVVASATLVKCDIKLPPGMTAGAWAVKVTDKSGRSAALAEAVAIR
jgi:hypothetical protein